MPKNNPNPQDKRSQLLNKLNTLDKLAPKPKLGDVEIDVNSIVDVRISNTATLRSKLEIIYVDGNSAYSVKIGLNFLDDIKECIANGNKITIKRYFDGTTPRTEVICQ